MQDYQLTNEEHNVWAKIANGLTYNEISIQLDFPLSFIKSTARHLCIKLGVRNRHSAAIKYLKEITLSTN